MNGKRNFVDFIKDASQPGSTLMKDIVNKISKPDVTAEELTTFFKTKGYGGVGEEDCTKLLSIERDPRVSAVLKDDIKY
jgi:hypothetical protein